MRGVVIPGDPRIRNATQLAAWLADSIVAGKWRPGHLLPSERDLIERFDVGRGLVRKAMIELRTTGLIDLTRGEGWEVRDPPDRESVRVQRGSLITARMPTPSERQQMDIPEGVPVVVVAYSGRERLYPADRWEFTTS